MRYLLLAISVSIGLPCSLHESAARAQTAFRISDEGALRRFIEGTWTSHERTPDKTYRWHRVEYLADGRTIIGTKSCIVFREGQCATEPPDSGDAPLETTWSVRRNTDKLFTLVRHWQPPFSPTSYRYTIVDKDTIRMNASSAGWSETYRRVR